MNPEDWPSNDMETEEQEDIQTIVAVMVESHENEGAR